MAVFAVKESFGWHFIASLTTKAPSGTFTAALKCNVNPMIILIILVHIKVKGSVHKTICELIWCSLKLNRKANCVRESVPACIRAFSVQMVTMGSIMDAGIRKIVVLTLCRNCPLSLSMSNDDPREKPGLLT
ncbi:hypothetical protein PISMIDRAFT_24248 [Pisolithus microcarpus 441]|uniref:Uncharacterized protein n=1 Tax=Pisolithus microcarpus 441 TaxID=765257 RepID=A0A0C9YTT5_9AGAM|nr:hypothetical protein PISMIDRAFT_24248 [Pisolithus microcarpus 441]